MIEPNGYCSDGVLACGAINIAIIIDANEMEVHKQRCLWIENAVGKSRKQK